MRTRTETPGTEERALPCDARAEAVFEFVFNDEEEALCSEHLVLIHQRDMPALQEYLREMFEIDSRAGGAGLH